MFLCLTFITAVVASDFTSQATAFANAYDQIRQNLTVPGMAIGIVGMENGKRVSFAQGLGVMTNETIHGIASISKAVTAHLLSILVDEGKLNWTTPLSHYMDVQFNNETLVKEANVVDLLSMRMGLKRSETLTKDLTPAQMLKIGQTMNSTMGFRDSFIYNNEVFALAGNLMNYLPPVNSSDPYYSWRQSLYSMFKTLGMNSSSAEPTDTMGTGYKWTGDAYKEYPKNISDCVYKLGPSGGINSNAVDFNKYMGFWLDSALQKNSSFNNILQVHNNHESTEGLGKYGLGGNVYNYKSKKYFVKSGTTMAHTSVFCAFPEQQVAAVLLVNTYVFPTGDYFCQDIADTFIETNEISVNGLRNVSSGMLNERNNFFKDNEEMKAKSINTTTLPLESYTGLIPIAGSAGDKQNISILSVNPPLLQSVVVAGFHPTIRPLVTYQYVPFGNNSFANIVNGKLWPAISTIFFETDGSVMATASKFNPC